MTSQVVTPGHKHQLACTSMPDCKRQDITESEDDSTDIVDHDVVNSTDLNMDEGGFRVVRHRKERTVDIPVILAAASEGANLRQVNPIALYSEIEAILGGAPVKSHFSAQGSLLLDIATEDQANALLETKNICGIAISARVPHGYMKNTCIVRGVPRWYSDEELLTYLKPQGVYHTRRIVRRVQASSSEWESRRTGSVVLTFAPNSERPEKINLGFTRHELEDYVETPRRCFKCQRSGMLLSIVVEIRGASDVGGPHDFKTCTSKEKLVCANCSGGHPTSYGRCPARTAAQRRNKTFVLGPKAVSESSNTRTTTSTPQVSGLDNEHARNFPRMKLTRDVTEPREMINVAEERVPESIKRTCAAALNRSKVTGSNQQENCEHVIRPLFMAYAHTSRRCQRVLRRICWKQYWLSSQ
ncbi:hypothetical protein MTO96_028803 [Rhipicephalus appendiculatus]